MPPEPRVIHLDDGREFRGGQFQVTLLAEELRARGVPQLAVVRPASPIGARLAELGVETVPFAYRGELDLRVGRFLERLARDRGADILHAHTAHAHTAGLKALRRARRRGNLALQLLTTRRVDFPIAHSWFSHRKYTFPDQNFAAISKGVADVLMAGGVPAERIDIVPSGVPAPDPALAWTRERARAEFGIGEDVLAIVNVGALVDHKGQRFLIEAAAPILRRYPTVHVFILGEGELRGELEALVASLGLQGRVHLPGHVPSAREKLAGFDLYVSSSHLEGMGTSILDAMLCGLPVVAAAAGGVTDIVEHGATGRLAPAGDAAGLSREILNALESSDDATERMARAARVNAELNYSARRMAEGNLAVYRRLAAEGRRRAAGRV